MRGIIQEIPTRINRYFKIRTNSDNPSWEIMHLTRFEMHEDLDDASVGDEVKLVYRKSKSGYGLWFAEPAENRNG